MDSKKLHILFLCSWYPSKASPTNGDFIQRHAEAVATLHKVSVLFITTLPNIKNVQYESTEKDNLTTHIVYIPHQKFGIMKWVFYFKYFFKLLKKIGQFDIVHLNRLYPFGVFALYLKFIRRKKYIISEHWSGYIFPNNLKYSELTVSKWITKHAVYISPVSIFLAQKMLDIGLKGNYHPIANVVDTDKFTVKNKDDFFTMIHISSLQDNVKNISGIIRVVRRLYEDDFDFKIKFIGGSSESNNKYLKQLNIPNQYVKFFTEMNHEEMIKHLQTADVLISFSHYETFSCVIKEAFSCGTPVISTNVGAIPEYFPDNFGTLIFENDEEALYQSIKSFKERKWADKNEMHSFAEKHFSKNVIANSFHTLYLKTI